MTTLSFEDIMLGRRSIRHYDQAVKITTAELEEILDKACSAPSSLNMQPWRFVVVNSELGKARVAPLMSYNQSQAETSAALIFIFGDLEAVSNVTEIMQGSVDYGTMTPLIRDQQIAKISGYYQEMTAETIKDTTLFDGGLLAMNLMLVARSYGYDTCPIGGFDKNQINQILDVNAKRYIPLLALSIGKAAGSGFDSYRLPASEITTWL